VGIGAAVATDQQVELEALCSSASALVDVIVVEERYTVGLACSLVVAVDLVGLVDLDGHRGGYDDVHHDCDVFVSFSSHDPGVPLLICSR
jgi:hypothetical protein